MKKINKYVFMQVFKSCTLIFFIFVSISWLLQISRLFSYMSTFQAEYINIFYLSIFLIPNLINIIMPFVVIFGLIIAFIKLDKDKEIIAMFSLGISIKEIIKPIYLFSFFIIIIYLILNLFLSPFVYDIYKNKEFNLRNNVDLNNINISNFIKLDGDIIIDFTKKNEKFSDVFIRYLDQEKIENIIYSKEAIILKEKKNIVFNLINGFKLSFNSKEIEKLEFEKYNFNFPISEKKSYNNYDKNSLTIFDLIKERNYLVINEKIFEFILIISIVFLFYFNNIKKNDYKLKAIFVFISISIFTLISQNIFKNIDLSNLLNILFQSINILMIYIYIIIISKKLLHND